MQAVSSGLQIRIDRKCFTEEGSERVVIRDLELSIPSGSFVTLLAPSGSGKSTLLRIIAGLDTDYGGEVVVEGVSKREAGRDVQLVFQDYGLFPWKTVGQNIAFAQSPNGNGKHSVQELIETLGLNGLQQRWPPNLSGGQKSLVAFARALVDQPKVLLLDEPFKNLDLFTKIQIQGHLIEALRNVSTTVIMASHSVEDAVFLSDRILLLSRSPMSLLDQFDIGKPRPRNRGDADLARISAQVVSACLTAFGLGQFRTSEAP